jgi:hypothetical protein
MRVPSSENENRSPRRLELSSARTLLGARRRRTNALLMPLFPVGPKTLRGNGLAHCLQSDQLTCLQISHFWSFQFLPGWHLFL